MFRVYAYVRAEWLIFGSFKKEDDAKEWAQTVHNHPSLSHPTVEVRNDVQAVIYHLESPTLSTGKPHPNAGG